MDVADVKRFDVSISAGGWRSDYRGRCSSGDLGIRSARGNGGSVVINPARVNVNGYRCSGN